MTLTLDELALKYHTDKSSEFHNYTATYEPLLEHARYQPITLLELGYLDGGSARMWRDFFGHPDSQIVAVDIEPKSTARQGITVYQTDQADADRLNEIHCTHGDFDIIIDDASHISSLTIRSFEILYPMLKPGGLYIVEDTHGAYHSHFYGRDEADKNPDTRQLTTMTYFKSLVDEVNFHGNGDLDLFPRKYWRGYSLDSVTFMFNLIIVRKAC